MEVLIWGTLITVLMFQIHIRVNDGLKALCECYNATEAFYQWRVRNPGVYVGLSPEGSSLVLRCLEAHDAYMKNRPHLDDVVRREFLLSLLDDFPPKEPDAVPFKKRATSTAALFFLYTRLAQFKIDVTLNYRGNHE